MTKFNIPVLSLMLFVMMASCKKQLTEFNPSGVTVESLLTTPDGFEAAVNATYTYNRSLYGREEGYALLEMGTDIWTNAANNGGTGTNGIFPQPPLTTYQSLIADNPWINVRLWQQCYAGINLCNTALKYIDQAGLIATRRPVLEAELRFMRAWYYWHLVESFGDVHFTLEPTETIVTTANRTPVATIYTQIFLDMNFAAANLPLTTGDYGRVTKPIAEAFLARLSLYRGNIQEASNYANNVIKNYGLKLLTNYADLWNINSQRNTEVLWAVNYSTNLAVNGGTSNQGHSMFLMEYNTLPGMIRDVTNGLPNVRYMPTRFLLNLFNETDDARYNASFRQAWIANNVLTLPKWTAAEAGQNTALTPLIGQVKFAVGDTAIFITKQNIDDFQQNYTTRYRYKTYDINDVYNSNGTPKDRFHYISLKKFDDPTRASATEPQSSRDAYLIRLAEMYLVAAEAQLKLNKLDSAAYFVNEVRKRAALPGRQAAIQITPAMVTLDFLLDERAREFAGEQYRWFDLRRTGKLVERVKLNNPDAAAYIQDFHMLRPIPQAQIDAVTNKLEFRQNPGY